LKPVEQGNYHAFDIYAFPPDYFVFTHDYLASDQAEWGWQWTVSIAWKVSFAWRRDGR
jgi:hypothetical protein